MLTHSCRPPQTKTYFSRVVKRPLNTLYLNTDTASPVLSLSKDFWKYYTREFNDASLTLFEHQVFRDYPDSIKKLLSQRRLRLKLSESTLDYAEVGFETRFTLVNRLPKSLRAHDRDDYWDNMGFFIVDSIPDSLQSPIDTSKVTPSLALQKEYEQFYKLVKAWGHDYVILFDKRGLDSMVRGKYAD